jgi:FtsP/CotA-like multicopper oxidase with cupredoxin domain
MKPYVRIGLLVVLIAGAAAVLPGIVATREQVHEIRVVAKNMTYYANGAEDPNPPIRLVPGEQVRITFRNDDRGMAHDFGIPVLAVGTGVIEFGTEKSFTFRVPDNPAPATYLCTPHSAMMSGRIFFAK